MFFQFSMHITQTQVKINSKTQREDALVCNWTPCGPLTQASANYRLILSERGSAEDGEIIRRGRSIDGRGLQDLKERETGH